MRTITTIASCAARHAVALGVVIATGCALWTVTYFTLLLWASIVEAGAGSPIVYPLGLLGIICGGTVVGLLLFLPATLIGELVCGWRAFPTLLGIPVAFVAFCLLAGFWSLVVSFFKDVAIDLSPTAGGIALLAVPFGLYWWTAEFPCVIRDCAKAVIGICRRRHGVVTQVLEPLKPETSNRTNEPNERS